MLYWLGALAAMLVLAEGVARIAGLGSPLLYERTGYGYRLVPGQSVTRLGNRVIINSFGMRSPPAETLPAPGVVRVLCIGDSITFGGSEVDQPQTYPNQLHDLLAATGARFEVLAVSAGGWAMENEEGWLAAHGVFGSRYVVLQVASHDLFQEKEGSGIVGVHPSFPDRKPLLALQELWSRYLWPHLGKHLPFVDPGVILYSRTHGDIVRNLASFRRIAQLVRQQGAELVVLFVEQAQGIEPEDEVTLYAKSTFLAKLVADGVPFVRSADAIEREGGTSLFRDAIHPNAAGNRVLASEIAAVIRRREGSGVTARP